MTPDTLASGTIVAGRYRVVQEIGHGGMGVVYLVEHVHTGEQFALKALRLTSPTPQILTERFQREARAPGRIKCENVVRVIDAGVAPELDGAPFLVMELLDGYGVDQLLEARGRMPAGELVAILRQVAVALDRAHALGIIHRDIKPENLFIHMREDGSPVVKVLDFGISKVLSNDDTPRGDDNVSTTTGVVMGTPKYMSPEQARGRGDLIGPASDVWSIGVVAMRMLTGEAYWKVSTMGDLMAHIIALPLEPPTTRWPWLPKEIDAWFLRSCDREPGRRFGTVGEQVRELATALEVTDAALALDPDLIRKRHVPSVRPPSPQPASPPRERSVSTLRESPQARSPASPVAAQSGAASGTGRGRFIGAVALGGAVVLAAIVVWLRAAGGSAATAPVPAAASVSTAASIPATPVMLPAASSPTSGETASQQPPPAASTASALPSPTPARPRGKGAPAKPGPSPAPTEFSPNAP